MEIMKRVAIAAGVILLLMVAGGVRPGWAQEEDEYEGPMSNMHFVVLRDSNGKPIKNAAVVLHPVNHKGKQALGGLELKTDDEGRTGIEGIPYGLLRVQVLAPGFQTFGEDYEIKQPETQVTVRLKPPTKQYSTYGVQEKEKKPDDKSPADKAPAEQKPQ
jgi:hypothetical protein